MSDDDTSTGSEHRDFVPKETSTTTRDLTGPNVTRSKLRDSNNKKNGRVLFTDSSGAKNTVTESGTNARVCLSTASHGEWVDSFRFNLSRTVHGSRMDESVGTNVSFNNQHKEVAFSEPAPSLPPAPSCPEPTSSSHDTVPVDDVGGLINVDRDDNTETDTTTVTSVPAPTSLAASSEIAANPPTIPEEQVIDSEKSKKSDDHDSETSRDNPGGSNDGGSDRSSRTSSYGGDNEKNVLFRIIRMLLNSISQSAHGTISSNLIYVKDALKLFNENFYKDCVVRSRELGGDMKDYSTCRHVKLKSAARVTPSDWESYFPQFRLAQDIYVIASSYSESDFNTPIMNRLFKKQEKKLTLLLNMLKQNNDLHPEEDHVTIKTIRKGCLKVLEEWKNMCTLLRIKIYFMERARLTLDAIKNLLDDATSHDDLDSTLDILMNEFQHYFIIATNGELVIEQVSEDDMMSKYFGVAIEDDFYPQFIFRAMADSDNGRWPYCFWQVDSTLLTGKITDWIRNFCKPTLMRFLRDAQNSRTQSLSDLSDSCEEIDNNVWTTEDLDSPTPSLPQQVNTRSGGRSNINSITRNQVPATPPLSRHGVPSARPPSHTTTIRHQPGPRSGNTPASASSLPPANDNDILAGIGISSTRRDRPDPTTVSNVRNNVTRIVDEQVNDFEWDTDDSDDDDDDRDNLDDDYSTGGRRKTTARDRAKKRKENKLRNILTTFITTCNTVKNLMSEYEKDEKRDPDGLVVDIPQVLAADELVSKAISNNEKLFSLSSKYSGVLRTPDNKSVNVSLYLPERRSHLTKMKRELEAREKETIELRKEVRTSVRNDFGKFKIDVINHKSEVLEWCWKIERIAKESKMSITDQRFVQQLQLALKPLPDDLKICQPMTDAQSILNYLRHTYASRGIASNNCFDLIINTWRQPKTVSEALGNISVIKKKFDALEWANVVSDVDTQTIYFLERLSFDSKGLEDYTKELSTFERNSQNAASYSFANLENPGDTTLSFDNRMFNDAISTVDRIDFYRKFAKDYAQANQRRINESKSFLGKFSRRRMEDTMNTADDYRPGLPVPDLNIETDLPAQDSINLTRSSNNGKPYNPGYDFKPCLLGCGTNHRNSGHPQGCDVFKKSSRANRIDSIKRNKLCSICLRRKIDSNHKCRREDIRECLTCKKHNPGSRFQHHYLLCRIRAEEEEQRRLTEQASATHKSSNDPMLQLNIDQLQEDFGAAGGPTNDDPSMNCLDCVDGDTTPGPFCGIVKQYIKTEYDIREELERLRRVTKEEKKSVPNDTNMPVKCAKPDIDPADAALIKDVFSKPRPPEAEESLNFVDVASLNPCKVDYKQLCLNSLKSKLELKKIDENHPNAALFKNLRDKSVKCFQAAGSNGKRILSVMNYKTPLKKDYNDEHGLIANGHIKVVYEDGDAYGVYHMQLDPGASISGCDAKLMSYLDCPLIDIEDQTIHGINDQQRSLNQIREVKLIGNDGKSTRVRMTCLEKIHKQSDYPITKSQQMIIEEEFRMSKKHSDLMHWHKGARVFGVFGHNCNVLHGVEVDPLVIGLRRPILNHQLKIEYHNFTYGAELSVCGAIGTDPDLLVTSDSSNTYPTFLVRPESEFNPELNIADRFDTRLFRIMQPETMSTCSENIKCLIDLDTNKPSAVEIAQWKQSENDSREHDIYINAAIRCETMNVLQNATDDDEDTSNEDVAANADVCNQIITDIINSDIDSEYESLCWHCEQIDDIINSLSHDESIILTKESWNLLDEWLRAENLYNYNYPVCQNHKSSITKCEDCKEHADGGFLQKKKLKQRIMDSLVIKPDPAGNGNFVIFQEINYFENNIDVGSFKSSMLEESLQSSVNAVKRAMRHKVLPEINKHLAKMVKKSAVRILTKTDMDKIIRGEIKVNFLARNFTEKGTSASTNVRFLADTARPIPHADGKTLSSVTAGPKGDINDLVKSGTIFHLNQRHVETDLSSAYWSIRIAESVGMLTLSVWFHQPEEYGTDQPVMMLPTAKEFGIGDSGSALKSAVEKFVVPELKDDPFLANIVAC